MEKKDKNISISVIKVPRVPNLAVCLCWKCPHANWYTLHKVKKGYKTNDPQFKEGGNCVVLCYSLFQRIKQLETSKNSIDCMTCNVHNGHFQICFSTENKLSKLKKTLKLIIKKLDPSKVWKQYAINMRNFNGRADKQEFNHVVAEMNKVLKSNISILACGSLKMTSKKDGKTVSEDTNLKNLASYLSSVFPKLSDPGKKSAPKSNMHHIPDDKEHTIVKVKNNTIGIEPALLSIYITKTLSIRADPDDRTVIVWNKNPDAKLKSIKKLHRIKRELFEKKNTHGHVVHGLLRDNKSDGCTVRKFYNKKPSVDAMARAVMSSL